MAEEGSVIGIHSVDHWKEHLQRHKETGKLMVVDFTASWCPPCRMIAPVFVEFAKKYTQVIFLKVDVDELQSIAEKYSVEAMPTFLFLKGGEEVKKIVGADKVQLEKLIVEQSAATIAA